MGIINLRKAKAEGKRVSDKKMQIDRINKKKAIPFVY